RSAHGGKTHNLAVVGNGHNPRDDPRRNAELLSPVAKIKVVAIVEKELGRDKVSATRDLRFQILQITAFIGAFGMHFRIASHPDAEIAKRAGQGNQLVGVRKTIWRWHKITLATRRITP